MKNVRDVYRRAVEDSVTAESKCPFDGFSCCSICVDCGRRFCECGESNACERMLGRGCSGIRGEGCPKGFRVDA